MKPKHSFLHRPYSPTIFLLSCLFLSFQPSSLQAQSDRDPQFNFEQLWETLDQGYSHFSLSQEEWRTLYEEKIPQIGPKTTSQQLFKDMGSLLDELDDFQLVLSGNLSQKVSGLEENLSVVRPLQAYQAYRTHTYGDMSLKVIEDNYLQGEFDVSFDGYRAAWLKDSIAYLHIRSFSNILVADSFRQHVFAHYASAKAFVLDVRASKEGNDKAAKLLADCFADQRRLYMVGKERKAGTYETFGPERYWHIEPATQYHFDQPVIVLASKSSLQAAEKFVLAMKTLPNAIVLGDTTRGALSDTRTKVLTNGWKLSYPFTVVADNKGNALQGIGVAPDSVVHNSKSQIKAGVDHQLGTAMRMLRSGWAGGEADQASLQRIQGPQFAELLEKGLQTEDWEDALYGYLDAWKADSAPYILEEELLAMAQNLAIAGKTDRAQRVSEELTLQIFPKSEAAHMALGYLYLETDDPTEARRYFHAVTELNPKNKEAKKQLRQLKTDKATPLVLFQKSKQKSGS